MDRLRSSLKWGSVSRFGHLCTILLALCFGSVKSDDDYPAPGYLTSEEDCPNLYEYFPDFCNSGHNVYHYSTNRTRKNGATSCEACTCIDGKLIETDYGIHLENEWYGTGPQCCPGWNGTRCDICLNKEICPRKWVNGTLREAVNCSSTSLTPTVEEAKTGKKYSCSCGGGDDKTSAAACNSQPGTSFIFEMYGLGTSEDPAELIFTEMAKIKRTTDVLKYHNKYPDINTYDYSNVFGGNITGCQLSHGKCMNVPFTDVSSQQCINWDCSDTELDCPPRGQPTCPMWNGKDSCECLNPTGIMDSSSSCEKHYQYKLCLEKPQNGVGFLMSCLIEPNEDGKHICYFTQPNTVAPLSMTCSVGNCLYEGDEFPVYPKTVRDKPNTVDSSIVVMGSASAAILLFCVILYGFAQYFEQRSARDDPFSSTALEKSLLESDTLEAAMPLSHNTAACLTWMGLNTWVPGTAEKTSKPGVDGRKRILHSLVGRAGPRPGESVGGVTALMGPSGAGKTSLLDVLAGRQAETVLVRGTVSVDGRVVEPDEMRSISAYVTQHDVLPGMMHVREHLMFHARLRMHKTTMKQKQDRVLAVLKSLKLESLADSLIGDEFTRGLSGGERRRLSIASELLVNRKLLFLDEPTTGLDSANAFNVTKLLAEVGKGPTTVILSIHQPRLDILEHFDQIYLLARGGRLAFCGSPSGIVAFFEPMMPEGPTVSNPADLMLDICSTPQRVKQVIRQFAPRRNEMVDEIQQYFEDLAGTLSDEGVIPSFESTRAPFSTQLLVLSTRWLRKSIRHPMLMCLHYLGAIVMAVILGTIFEDMKYDLDGVQNRIGVLFFILFYLSLLSITSLPVWRDENLLFEHEFANGIYCKLAYLLSYVFFDIFLLRLLPPLAFTLITYEWINLQEYGGERAYVFSFILVLANGTMSLYSMALGAMKYSTTLGNLLGALMILIFTLTCGLLVNTKQLNANFFTFFFHRINPLAYSFEGLVINQFHATKDKDGEDQYYTINATVCSSDFPVVSVSGDTILSTLDYKHSNSALESDVIFLAILMFAMTFKLFMTFLGWDHWIVMLVKACLCLGERKGKTQREAEEEDHDRVSLVRESRAASLSVESLEGDPDLSQALDASGSGLALSGRTDATAGVLVWDRVNLWVHGPRKSVKTASASRFAPKNKWFNKQVLNDISGYAGPVQELPGFDARAVPPATQSCPGDLCTLMGPSGAGKTSLLDVLAGRKSQGVAAGEISMNGVVVNAKERRKRSGYVVQEDILPSTMTVRELMLMHAALRVPKNPQNTRAEERSRHGAKVEDLCTELGLWHVKDTVIGDAEVRGLSGGEKRRVSIALELLGGVSFIFLDEPTTGLDSANALLVVELLSMLAQQGTTVILSIHQPRKDIFELLRRVVVLSRGGYMVYSGPAATVGDFISHVSPSSPLENKKMNPADIMLDVVASVHPSALLSGYRECEASRHLRATLASLLKNAVSRNGSDGDAMGEGASQVVLVNEGSKDGMTATAAVHSPLVPSRTIGLEALEVGEGVRWDEVGPVACKHMASWWTQFELLATRAGRKALRSSFLLVLHVFIAIAAALATGLGFYNINQYNHKTTGVQDRLGLMFFILLYLSLMSLSSLPIWRDDQRLFVHDRAAGVYTTSPYFLTAVLFDLIPYRLLPPAIFTAIAFPMIKLSGLWTKFLLILVVYNLCISTICMLIGVVTSSNAVANAVGSLSVLFSLLFAGFLNSSGTIPNAWKWVQVISPSYYAYNALLLDEFQPLDDLFITTVIGDNHEKAGPFTGRDILNCFDFAKDSFDYYLWWLLFLFGGFLTLTYLALLILVRERR